MKPYLYVICSDKSATPKNYKPVNYSNRIVLILFRHEQKTTVYDNRTLFIVTNVYKSVLSRKRGNSARAHDSLASLWKYDENTCFD